MTQVLFKFKGKFAKSCGDKIHAMYRKFAMVEKFEKVEGKDYWVCELGEFDKFVYEKVADHAAKIVEFAAAAKAAAEAAKAEKDKTKDDPKTGMDPKVEGEGEAPVMMEAAVEADAM